MIYSGLGNIIVAVQRCDIGGSQFKLIFNFGRNQNDIVCDTGNHRINQLILYILVIATQNLNLCSGQLNLKAKLVINHLLGNIRNVAVNQLIACCLIRSSNQRDDLICGQHTLGVSRDKRRNHIQLLSACDLGSSLKVGHDLAEGIAGKHVAETENGLHRYGIILTQNNGLLECQIDGNGHSLIRIGSGVSELCDIVHFLVSLNLIESDSHDGSGKHAPNHTVVVTAQNTALFTGYFVLIVFVILVFIDIATGFSAVPCILIVASALRTNNRLHEAVTNNRTLFQRISIRIDHAGYVIGLGKVELCVLVYLMIGHLHERGQTGNELVDRINKRTHQVADGHTLDRLVIRVCTKGVHNGNENDLNIGIHLQDRVHGTCVVQQQRNGNVERNVYQILIIEALHQRGLQIIDQSQKLCLQLGLTLTEQILIVVVQISRTTAKADDLKDTAKAEYTEVTVTDGQRDHVRVSNVLLVVLRNDRDLLTHADSTGLDVRNVIQQIRMIGQGLAVVSTAFICLVLAANDVIIAGVGTGMVADLIYGPIVTASEICFPLLLIPDLVVFVVFSNKFVNDFDQLVVRVVELQQPVNVLGTDTGHCQLRVVDVIANGLQRVRKLVGVCPITVVLNAGVMVITLQAVAVGHGVTERDVVQFTQIYVQRPSQFMIVLMLCRQCRNGRSAYADHHNHRHDESYYFLHTHIVYPF